MPQKGDELYLNFNATIASLDSGDVVHNGSLVGGKLFDSSGPGTTPRTFNLGTQATNKANRAALTDICTKPAHLHAATAAACPPEPLRAPAGLGHGAREHAARRARGPAGAQRLRLRRRGHPLRLRRGDSPQRHPPLRGGPNPPRRAPAAPHSATLPPPRTAFSGAFRGP